MIRLRNVRLATKFVYRDDPGVWKKVSSNKARCVFGPQKLYNVEMSISPDAEVFIIEDTPPRDIPPREIPRILPPLSNDTVRVIFENQEEVVLLERTVTWQEAMFMAESEAVVLRPAPRRRKEVWYISDVGYDMEEHALHFEISMQQPVALKKGEQEDVEGENSEVKPQEEKKNEDGGIAGTTVGNP